MVFYLNIRLFLSRSNELILTQLVLESFNLVTCYNYNLLYLHRYLIDKKMFEFKINKIIEELTETYKFEYLLKLTNLYIQITSTTRNLFIKSKQYIQIVNNYPYTVVL